MIGNLNTLSFFCDKLRTRLITDAGPEALGAALLQFPNEQGDDDPRIIAYASKSLTVTEKKCCQTEKEALAVVWGVEKFHIYLIGRRFELETDHKPLQMIFTPTSRSCARIERWVLRLQSFDYVIKYRKGAENIADPLSRISQTRDTEGFDGDSEFLVLAILESAAEDVSEVERESKEDEELNEVKRSLSSGNWNDKVTKPYAPFERELCVMEDLLVRGNKLVIPNSLRPRMLELAHEGHPGESSMKKRLRDRVWWPGMDKEAERYVKTCEGCRLVGLSSRPEPMSRKELPSQAWIDVALDFLGPLPSNEYILAIVDYYSRYMEIEIMSSITARMTINRLDKIFVRRRVPRLLSCQGNFFELYNPLLAPGQRGNRKAKSVFE